MKSLSRGMGTLVALALVAAACGQPAEPAPTDPTPTAPAVTAGTDTAPSPAPPVTYRPLPLGEAVAALQNPDTATQGVLGILDELNIGVYTADGTQILAGSETGPDDLYVLAELLPGMAVSARRDGPTVETYMAEMADALDIGLTPAELAAVYTVMTATLPDHPMSRVLRALDVDFSPETRLTRFEAWLLMLVWVPPNGGDSARGGGPVFAAGAPAALYQVRCPANGDGSKPGYDLANQYGNQAKDQAANTIRDLIADDAIGGASAQKVAKFLQKFGEAVGKYTMLLDAAKIGQIFANTDISVETEPLSTHEVHTTEGETYEDKLVKVTVRIVYLGSTAASEDACAFVGMLGLPDPNTPIEGARVDFTLDDTLAEHGFTRHRVENDAAVVTTDGTGTWVGWYQPKDEEPESAQKLSDAFNRKADGTYTLTINLTTAMGQLFNLFAGVEFAMNLVGKNQIDGEITVGWHDPAARIRVAAPLEGFVGERVLTLETCNGTDWTGSFQMEGTLTTPEGRMQVSQDSPLALTIPTGQNFGDAAVQFDSTLSGSAGGATFVDERSQPGTLRLELRDDGMAMVGLDLEVGSQAITVSSPQGTISYSAAIEPHSESYTVALEPASCDE